MKSEQDSEVPYFIKVRGCVNCEVSQSKKEKTGTRYGFDHELMATCLFSGCDNYGVNLQHPFIDPEEVVAKIKEYPEKYGPKERENARKYLLHVKELFGKFYEKIEIPIDDFINKL